MKTRSLIAAALCTPFLALPLAGCEGESLTKAIPKTEDRLNDYALQQIYAIPITTGEQFDASSLKQQIDPLVAQHGEEQVVEVITSIAKTHEQPTYRIAAVFSIRPYVTDAEFSALADEALDDASRAELDALLR